MNWVSAKLPDGSEEFQELETEDVRATYAAAKVRVGPVTTFPDEIELPNPDMEVETDHEESEAEEAAQEEPEEAETPPEETKDPEPVDAVAYAAQLKKNIKRLRVMAKKNDGKGYYDKTEGVARYAIAHGIKYMKRKREEVYRDIAAADLDAKIAKMQEVKR
ncbi:MAG: hypothetical protein ACW99U_18330 [Candidatus Thorarchaeota archaeon]